MTIADDSKHLGKTHAYRVGARSVCIIASGAASRWAVSGGGPPAKLFICPCALPLALFPLRQHRIALWGSRIALWGNRVALWGSQIARWGGGLAGTKQIMDLVTTTSSSAGEGYGKRGMSFQN
jgi:hypothetical protein